MHRYNHTTRNSDYLILETACVLDDGGQHLHMLPRCNILAIKIHAGTNFVGYNIIVYRMMHGMNNNKLVSCQLSDHPAFFTANGFSSIQL